MLKKLLLFCFCLIVLNTACNRNEETLYKVIKVKDGDTIELLAPDHQNVTVRLAEIDCPEKSQAFGQAAKKFTAQLCFGKMVKLIGSQHDQYGRTVAKIELDDGKTLNYELVKNGYAWQYRAYSTDMALALMEQRAREQHLGLWQDANPTPPWNYRKTEKRRQTDEAGEKPKKHKRHYKKQRSYYRDIMGLIYLNNDPLYARTLI